MPRCIPAVVTGFCNRAEHLVPRDVTGARSSPVVFADVYVSHDGGDIRHGAGKGFLLDVRVMGVKHAAQVRVINQINQLPELRHGVTKITFKTIQSLRSQYNAI